MTTKTHEEREYWRDIDSKPFRIEDLNDGKVLTILLLAAIGTSVLSAFFHGRLDAQWLDGFWQNFSTEMFGAYLTYLLLQKMVGTRNYKQQLLRQVRSRSNDTAMSAVDALREEGWLDDDTLYEHNMERANLKGLDLKGGRLQRVDLTAANLQGASLWQTDLTEARMRAAKLQEATFTDVTLHRADLSSANLDDTKLMSIKLQGADLYLANLRNAILYRAHLEGSHLRQADLQGADLRYANLQETVLCQANLQEVDLEQTDLRGANLEFANLHNAKHIEKAIFDENTTLPSGAKWHGKEDVSIYTQTTWKPNDQLDRWYWEQQGWLTKDRENITAEQHTLPTTDELLKIVLQELKLLREGRR
ncbi:MAG: pentapeptide repeat-containing protein [Chloroflexi bacterium]|nr:pentapeptide repeat-containing protein [Chloroflexota bacterium]